MFASGAITGGVAGAVARVSGQIQKISDLQNYRNDSLINGELRPLGSAFVSFTDLRSAITANKVQQTSTHCNTLQHTAILCNTLTSSELGICEFHRLA